LLENSEVYHPMIYSRAEPTVSARQALYVTNADFERLAHLYRIELGSVKDRFASPDLTKTILSDYHAFRTEHHWQ